MKKTVLFLFMFSGLISMAQPTIGLQHYDIPNADGYILFSPMNTNKTFLINKCGEKVNEWTSQYKVGHSQYLLEDGNLLRAGIDSTNNTFFVSGGIIELKDWTGSLLWTYTLSSTTECQHHDIHAMPNGNVLVIAWEVKTKAEAIAAGRIPGNTSNVVWSEEIVEIQPTGPTTGDIVWEWHLWDHMVQHYDSTKANYGVVADHPELICVNQYAQSTQRDWIHMNALDYNPELDQIMLSAHAFSELWIIDHSTTTAIAAGHSGGLSGKGGDILYRWGNPLTYGRGTAANKKLYGQHNVQWIKPGMPNAGKIIVFNNGFYRFPLYSSIDIIDPPLIVDHKYTIDMVNAFLPDTVFWSYTAPVPSDFYSMNISGVEPVADGSFVINEGIDGRFFEIDHDKNTIWQYTNPYSTNGAMTQGNPPQSNPVFRANFYSSTYPGLEEQLLIPYGEIELNPTSPSICYQLGVGITPITEQETRSIYPNPTTGIVNINFPLTSSENMLEVFNEFGQSVMQAHNQNNLDLSSLPKGIYYIRVEAQGKVYGEKVVRD